MRKIGKLFRLCIELLKLGLLLCGCSLLESERFRLGTVRIKSGLYFLNVSYPRTITVYEVFLFLGRYTLECICE